MNPILIAALALQMASAPQFAVVSIKPSELATTQKSIHASPDGGFRAENYSLKDLIKMGWDVRWFQITGGPPWLDSMRYDVETKPEAPLKIGNRYGMEQRMLMVQSMLADRFQLTVHRQTREENVYFLTVNKTGVRMKRTGDAIDASTSMGDRPGRMTARKIDTASLARYLAGELGVEVLDRTFLTGVYDVELEWNPDENASSSESTTWPSIFTAVQEQLGLRLEPGKGPIDMLVVDSAQKASPN